MTQDTRFTSYQTFIIGTLALLQFAIVLDFMVMSPLSAQLMPALNITPTQFGLVVSAYAFSAGAAGLLAAGFADKFDRKKLLLFFMAGFLIGTLLCGLAPNYPLLLGARIVTGLFGGVIGSISYAIITDLFEVQQRGRVMGFVQMAFAVSQVLGLPAGLYFSNLWDWHAPFLMIVVVTTPLWFVIAYRMRPVSEHLALQKKQSAAGHLFATVSKPFYLRAFAATTLLATGGFMLMPFGAAFAVNNLGIGMDDLPIIYLATGIVSMIAGPLIGRLTDRYSPMPLFLTGTALSIVLVLFYTHLGITPLWVLIILNSVLFVGITARMISSSTLITSVPTAADRGAFMGVNSSVAQISGGISSATAGLIIHQTESGMLENYPLLGWVVATTMIVCALLMWGIAMAVRRRDRTMEAV
jgi:predicted MFS family arabinose efflux permease